MANAANTLTLDNGAVDPCTRKITGTVGTNGSLVVGAAMNTYEHISIQTTGASFDGLTATAEISNDGVNYEALPTALAFSAKGIKFVPKNELGFVFLRLTMTNNGANSSVPFIVVCSRTNERAKFPN
jgi:hypothetical protein